MGDDNKEKGVVKDFFDNLEHWFHYLLPGGIFILYVIIFHQAWLDHFKKGAELEFGWYVAVPIILAIGTSAYVLQRYSIVPIIDYSFFILGVGSFVPKKSNFLGRLNPCFYFDNLSQFLKKRFELSFCWTYPGNWAT